MISEFKIGDHIKKVFNNPYIAKKIFKIVDLKEVKGGNWHDGFSVSIIATIEPIIPDTVLADAVLADAVLADAVNPETETEEFCIQYINIMCQINNIFARRIE